MRVLIFAHFTENEKSVKNRTREKLKLAGAKSLQIFFKGHKYTGVLGNKSRIVHPFNPLCYNCLLKYMWYCTLLSIVYIVNSIVYLQIT